MNLPRPLVQRCMYFLFFQAKPRPTTTKNKSRKTTTYTAVWSDPLTPPSPGTVVLFCHGVKLPPFLSVVAESLFYQTGYTRCMVAYFWHHISVIYVDLSETNITTSRFISCLHSLFFNGHLLVNLSSGKSTCSDLWQVDIMIWQGDIVTY